MKARLVACAVLVALLLALPGCGGSGSSSSGPASVAPPRSLLFVDGTVRPSGQLKSNVDAIAARVAGVESLGDFVVEELEAAAREDGEPFDFQRDVEPWLGDRAGVFFRRYDGEDFSRGGAVVQTTDPDATRAFVEKQAEAGDDPSEEASYEGVDYTVVGGDDTAIGVVGEFLVIAEDEQSFKDAVDASGGESLADEDRFETATAAAPEGSLADVYVDVGGMIEQSGEGIADQLLPILRSAGIDPGDATALASLVPGSERVEIDLSSDLGGEEAPTGDASELLGSLPAGSFAAFAVSGFGEQLEEAIDGLDASGIPGQIPPDKLKSGLKESGIDLDRIAGSLGDVGVFAAGRSESSLEGALVLDTDQPSQAAETVANIGQLLRNAGTSGIGAVTGKASGFSIRSEDLGSKPLVVVAKGDRIAIGYGLAPALRGVSAEGDTTLSETPAYREAVAALGDIPIGAFVDGPAALRLAESLVPRSETGFHRDAKPYLRKIRSVALGSGSEGDLATAKLIVSLK